MTRDTKIVVLVTVVIFLLGLCFNAQLRQKPLTVEGANRNDNTNAYDIPLDNNSTTIRRGYRAMFQAEPVPEPFFGAPTPVDQIVFEPRDRIGDFTWQKPISEITIPANESSTINTYVIDPKLAGTWLKGNLTIEFSAEERIQPVHYDLFVMALRTLDEVPRTRN